MIQVSFPSRGAAPQPCLTLCFLEALLHEKKKNSKKENKPEVLLTGAYSSPVTIVSTL